MQSSMGSTLGKEYHSSQRAKLGVAGRGSHDSDAGAEMFGIVEMARSARSDILVALVDDTYT